MTGWGKAFAGGAALILIFGGVAPARADDDSSRQQRWKSLQTAIFGNRAFHDGQTVLELKAPIRADDAALVPMSIESTLKTGLKGVYLIIDDNSSPIAAHFSFGPDADPRELSLRVRINQYTLVHAVAETQDGKLYVVSQFVKAAGGCSAPGGMGEEAALRGVGQMKLRELDQFLLGKTMQAQLLIRHPNFNGMQMNQVTRLYTSPRFINSVDVSYRGEQVFHLDSDISMSADPAITFGFVASAKGRIDVTAKDSIGSVFTQSFAIPAGGG